MRLFVVRHAHAGSRSNWDGDDRLRPLSRKGRRQADALAEALVPAEVRRLVSSPSLRCIETLRPLADRAGLVVRNDDRLAEGRDGDEALALAEELRQQGGAAVLCSHGDVIPHLLTQLKASGTAFHHSLTWPKGSTWVLSSNGSHWTDAEYLPNPTRSPA